MTDHDIDLEDRLRADADRDRTSAPSFEDALSVAVTSARRRTPWIAAAASVVLVAGLATAAAVWRGAGDDGTSAVGVSVPGLPSTRGKEVLRRLENAGFEGVLRVPGDARALDVLVSYSTEVGACSLFRPEITIVAQTPAIVRLRASGYSYLPKSKPGQRYVGFSCTGVGTKAVRITLDEPIGSRRVQDDVNDTKSLTTPVDPADFPAPTHVPAGYVALPAQPPSADDGNPVGERHFERGSDSLDVRFGATGDLDPDGSAQGTAVVAGHRAHVTGQSGSRCVTWTTSPGIARQVCSEAGGEPLPVAELLRVARSLR